MSGTGTKDDPWALKTPPGTGEYVMYRDDDGKARLAATSFEEWLQRQPLPA